MSSAELLLAHADRAMSPPATPPARSRTGTPRRTAPGPGRPADPLLGAITAVIHQLGDAGRPATGLDEGHRRTVEAMLREALPAHASTPAGAVSAVTVACSYLATDDLEDAYFALLTARDLLR